MRLWSTDSEGNFTPVFNGREKIEPGIYSPACSNSSHYLSPVRLKTDGLIELPDTITASILEEFREFWKLGNKFKDHGFLHKRGYLLWGPPGGGKTSLINLLMRHVVENMKGIVLNITRHEYVNSCLKIIRHIDPDIPLIILMEDIDALVREAETHYLSILDGSAQVDKVVFVATTNYPEMLDKRFKDRPSRFDTICYVGMPKYEQRLHYLTVKGLEKAEAEHWARMTDGFSIAHLREMMVAVKCLDQPFEVALARLTKMREELPNSNNPPEDEGTTTQSGFIPIRTYKGKDKKWEEKEVALTPGHKE